jgi:diguanylate cyclase
MSPHDFVALNLSAGPQSAASSAHLQLLDGTLALLRDLLIAEHDPRRTAAAGRLEACRKAVAAGAPPEEVASMGAVCLAEGREIVTDQQALQATRAREMASLVAALREVVAAVGSEMSTLNSGLEESSARFDALSQLSDPVRIGEKLLEEIAGLKQLTVSRRRAWEETANRLNQRIATLEHQLVATQSEASTDPLTEISNRRVFERTCEDWIETPRASFVLAMVDVDDLKRVNDTHGHGAGDKVLHFVAQMLARSVRAGDVVCRIGGDEFAVLAPNLSLTQAEQRLRSVLTAISTPEHAKVDRPSPMTGVSCGLAEFSAGDSFKTLVKRADDALYAAKRNGKNRLVAKPVPFIKDLLR